MCVCVCVCVCVFVCVCVCVCVRVCVCVSVCLSVCPIVRQIRYFIHYDQIDHETNAKRPPKFIHKIYSISVLATCPPDVIHVAIQNTNYILFMLLWENKCGGGDGGGGGLHSSSYIAILQTIYGLRSNKLNSSALQTQDSLQKKSQHRQSFIRIIMEATTMNPDQAAALGAVYFIGNCLNVADIKGKQHFRRTTLAG